MNINAIKYFSPLVLYFGAINSFTSRGWVCFAPLIYAWILIPLLELILKPDPANLTIAEEEIAKQDRMYDFVLYAVVFLQLPALVLFLSSLQDKNLSFMDITGRIGTMGLLCGTIGINVGHELGHRSNRIEQALAKFSLMTSLYMHFYIEHNRGHHKNVATPGDPSSARYGESLYSFWLRSITFSYTSAWRIARQELIRKQKPILSFKNEMIQMHIIQSAFLVGIWLVFGPFILACFLAAALMGILLLETVNYIEHYGLVRKQVGENKYERAMPAHSWNSDHVIGRLMLFELSRHSDHHYLASRKYQVLRHHEDSPEMPTGYPGMMILSLIPPVWFYIMNRRLKEISAKIPVQTIN